MATGGIVKAAMASKAATNAASLSTSAAVSAGRQGRREPRTDLSGPAALASLKKGPGYRSSFSGHVATVFGSSGCVGRSVCNRLGKNGTQMVLPYRGDHYRMMRLKVCGDLGQVLFTPYHLKDEESIRRSLTHSDVAVNLTGSALETSNFSYREINVEGPARLARIAREMGVERFFHISHVNARENPDTVFLPRGSEWLRTKWMGEQRVLEEFPDATIIRASDVYGKGDNFVHYFLRAGRRSLNSRMPLWARGDKTVKAPVYFGDLGLAIANAIDMPQSKGVTYEAYGPERYLLGDLVDWMYHLCHKDEKYWHYKRTDLRFDPVPFVKAFLIQNLPIGSKFMGKMSLDLLERECLSDDIQGLPNLADLGVDATSVLDKIPFEAAPYLSFGYAEPTFGEEPPTPDPVPLSRMEIKELTQENKGKGLLGHLGLTPGN